MYINASKKEIHSKVSRKFSFHEKKKNRNIKRYLYIKIKKYIMIYKNMYIYVEKCI